MSPPFDNPLIKDTPSVIASSDDTSPKGGGETWLPLWGPLRAGGTLPSGRPNRQARRWQRVALTERAPLKGVHKGGGLASPFGIKL